MQWNPSNASSVNVLYPPLLSPGPPYVGNATYSFTADFRPNNQSGGGSNNQIPNTSNSIALNNIGNTNSSAQNLGTILEPISKSPLSPLTSSTQKSFYQSNICYTTPKTSPIFEVSLSDSLFFA
jgi:hypothetical protein